MHVATTRGHAPAGPWLYAEARPDSLAPFVDHLWAFRGPTANTRKRVFPNGCVELLINFGAPYRTVGSDAVSPHAWVAGPTTGPLVVIQPAHQDCLGVRLRPEGARRLTRVPLGEVAAAEVDLEDLAGPVARELRERCAGVAPTERFAIVARWIAERILPAPARLDATSWVAREIRASHGARPIEALRREVGWSKRRLLAAFRDRVGLTPKRYARVARFHHALGLLQHAPPERSLAEVAIDAGFYDQPHMNAEFRALGGVTPAEFVRRRHPVGDGTTAIDGG